MHATSIHPRLPTEPGARFAELFDKFGFIATFLAGAVGILLMKRFGVSQTLVTVYALAVMVFYAAVIFWSPRLRLREDQAGDNIYYLGLLFTLVSLAWALWIFEPEAGAKRVIESFGIALATTILGLALRILFNQMRQNLVEIEREARLELTEAANRVRGSLDQIVLDMSDFHRTIQQATVESQIDVAEKFMTIVSKSMSGLESLNNAIAGNIEEAFKGLNKHSTRVTTVAGVIVDALEKHAASLGKLTEGTTALEAQIAALAKTALDAEKGLNGLLKKTAEMKTAQAAITEAAASARAFIAEQAIILADLRTSLETYCTTVGRAATAWESAEGEVLKRLVARGSATQRELEEQMAKFHTGQAQSLTRLSDALESTVSAAAAHNAALAHELETSRQYTLQVHKSLVDMTAELIDRLEPRESGAPTR